MALRRAWRYGLLGLGVVVVLVVAAAAIFIARFNPNSLKPRIEVAVEQATGRTLALNGPIGLKLSLWPTVELRDVALANPPGFSRPQMATLNRLDLQLAVFPLLHGQIAIDRLVLVNPNILLEVNAQGQSNWQFKPAPSASPSATTPGSSGKANSSGSQVSVSNVQIQDGTLAWRDDRTGKTDSLALTQLSATSESPASPMQLNLKAAYDNVPFTLGGEVGPLERLQQPDVVAPWPVKLNLAIARATISVDGSLTKPLQGRGYTLAVHGSIPDLTAFAPLLPGIKLPPLHDLVLSAQLSDSGGPVPHVEAATLHLGPADLGGYVTGLNIVSVDIDAPKQNQPVHIATQVTMANTPVSLDATLGAPGALMANQPAAPVPVDVALHAANASLTVKGSVAHPETLSGADLALTAAIPDLSALSPVAHRPLPAVKQIAFQGRLTDAPGGFEHGAVLQSIKLTTADGDLSGNFGVATGAAKGQAPTVPSITGKLQSNRIDADALLASMGKPVTAPPPPAAKPPAPPPPPPHTGPARLFPDTPIPFGLVREADANVALAVGDLRSGGLDYRNIVLHVVLQNGKLRLDPVSADLPEGKLSGSLNVDAAAAAPPVALTLHAPGLAVAPLLAAAGLPGYASGKLEVYADLHGAGVSPHAIAAGLDGSLGLAMQNGTIDTQLLNHLLGTVLQKANLLGLLSHGGSSELRCFALRADAHHGIADIRTLLLNSSLLTMDGSGSANLGNETLDLNLRPQGRVAGTGIVVPMRVTGPIESPNVTVNAIGTAESNVGTVAGAVIGSATPLGLLGGALGGDKLLGGGGAADSCAGPLALARGEAPPAAAAPSQRAATPSKSSNPANMLRQLFR